MKVAELKIGLKKLDVQFNKYQTRKKELKELYKNTVIKYFFL